MCGMPTGLVTAYLGLGANLGDPVQQIIDARRLLLASDGIDTLNSSSLYVSSPVGYSEQPYFVNCVAGITTKLSSTLLFKLMQAVERQLGRERKLGEQNAARRIDLDLLLYSDQRINTVQLTVPHPRMTDRLFVLEPLAELQPSLLVGDRGCVSDILEMGRKSGAFTDQTLFRLA